MWGCLPTCTPLWLVDGPVDMRGAGDRVDADGEEEGLTAARAVRAQARRDREEDIAKDGIQTKANASSNTSRIGRRLRAR